MFWQISRRAGQGIPFNGRSDQPTIILLLSKAAAGARYSLATLWNHHYFCERHEW